jgi:hypothetical protein
VESRGQFSINLSEIGQTDTGAITPLMESDEAQQALVTKLQSALKEINVQESHHQPAFT